MKSNGIFTMKDLYDILKEKFGERVFLFDLGTGYEVQRIQHIHIHIDTTKPYESKTE